MLGQQLLITGEIRTSNWNTRAMPPRDPEVDSRISVAMSDDNGIKRLSQGSSDRSKRHGSAVATNGNEIPWRTSKRLQAATLRLLQERDGGNLHGDTIAKNASEDIPKATVPVPAGRSPKGRQEVKQKRRKKGENVPTKDADIVESSVWHQETRPSVVQKDHVEAGACQTTRKTLKRKKGIEELSEGPPLNLDGRDEGEDKHEKNGTDPEVVPNANEAASRKVSEYEIKEEVGAPCSPLRALASVVDSMAASMMVGSNSSKQPQSCFDLLCSNIGHRGWRCYRSRVPGQMYCTQHQRSVPSSAYSK